MADCVNWIFLSAKENYEYAGFLYLKKIGDATVELEVIKEIWGEENLCRIYIMSLIQIALYGGKITVARGILRLEKFA